MTETTRGRGVPTEIDKYIGSRLATARVAAGMSQVKVGETIGVSSNQIIKYEKGMNRVAAARLWTFAVLYKKPIEFFFEEIDPLEGVDPEQLAHAEHVTQQLLEMVQLFRLAPSETRHHIMGLLRSTAEKVD